MTTTKSKRARKKNQMHTIELSSHLWNTASTSLKWRAYMLYEWHALWLLLVAAASWWMSAFLRHRRKWKINGRKNVEIPWNARMSLKIDLKCLQMHTHTVTPSLTQSFYLKKKKFGDESDGTNTFFTIFCVRLEPFTNFSRGSSERSASFSNIQNGTFFGVFSSTYSTNKVIHTHTHTY